MKRSVKRPGMTFASLLVLSLSLGCVAEAASPQDAKSKPVPTPPISSTAGKSGHHTPDYVLLKARHVGFKLKDGEAEKDGEDSQSQDQLYRKCIDESDGTNTAWAECGGAWLEREDEKLNAVWKKLYAAASGKRRKTFWPNSGCGTRSRNRLAISMRTGTGAGKDKCSNTRSAARR